MTSISQIIKWDREEDKIMRESEWTKAEIFPATN
jgi:hypothetical protein